MNGLYEILTNKQWMVNPEFVHGFRSIIQNNLNNHASLDAERKEIGCRVMFTRDGISSAVKIKEERYSAKDGSLIRSWKDNADDPFINVMFVDGPITRNGGACSYGSVQHRDMMMTAADNANCVGHIFHINTPGGSAWAKNDYQQAIDYARSKKQPVVAFIDGMCCSAGMYLAALCDQRFYMHPEDEIGCIGVMAAFYTEKDGSTCQYSNETYHELYDPESFDKNKEIRDIANDNNDKLLVEELARLGVQFRKDVKAACPNATDEHLHGKVFAAKDVKGILMDGQKSLGEVFNVVIDAGVKNGLQSAQNAKNMFNQKPTEMKEKFPALFAALAVEEMQMTEEGAFLNMGLLETLNASILAKNKEVEDAQALVASLTTEKENLQKSLDEKTSEIETLNNTHTAAIEEKDNQISTLTTEKEDLQKSLNEKSASVDSLTAELKGAKDSLGAAQTTIAERDQQITDLNARIEEMEKESNDAPDAGSPRNNGEGAAESQIVVGSTYVFNPLLTYEQNMEAMKKWDEEHGK